nr:MAG TPA_asm: hypothetical protein [Caudoviricetes sp.]
MTLQTLRPRSGGVFAFQGARIRGPFLFWSPERHSLRALS